MNKILMMLLLVSICAINACSWSEEQISGQSVGKTFITQVTVSSDLVVTGNIISPFTASTGTVYNYNNVTGTITKQPTIYTVYGSTMMAINQNTTIQIAGVTQVVDAYGTCITTSTAGSPYGVRSSINFSIWQTSFTFGSSGFPGDSGSYFYWKAWVK